MTKTKTKAQLELENKQLKAENKKLTNEKETITKNIGALNDAVEKHYYDLAIENAKALSMVLPCISQSHLAPMLAELCDLKATKEGKVNFNDDIEL